jgi:ADP-L-glycero-D-manno-heptose 6-epimerase
MIVVTGAAGFIGSCMVGKLNSLNIDNIIIVDDFNKESKLKNWENKHFCDKIQREDFFKWAELNIQKINFIIHLGARTDTTESDYSVFEDLNLSYSQRMWSFATKHGIPLLYASSAATYGDGEFGYSDSEENIPKLVPLNAYGKSKNEFDKWVLKQKNQPPYWAGFKFFNVYGPNEYHKGRMASVIYHCYNQIHETGKIKLFRSHNQAYLDGEQLRDFIYVKDVVNVLYWFLRKPRKSSIYNLGTGYARHFLSLANATFKALNIEPSIEFIDIPLDIRNQYQYYTQAEMKKMKSLGYRKSFHSLENGIDEYVTRYLKKNMIY